MSIFGSIVSAIFGKSAQAAPAAPGAAPSAAPAGSAPSGAPGAAPVAPKDSVDVTAILDKLADDADQELDWRKSIVDLMKLLGLDSRATELKYSGDMNDSASMNIWLHKQVMTKLAENGGKVPADLKH
jgi:hypothetical protein